MQNQYTLVFVMFLLSLSPFFVQGIHGGILRRGIAKQTSRTGRYMGRGRRKGERIVHLSHRAQHQSRRIQQGVFEDECRRSESQPRMVSLPGTRDKRQHRRRRRRECHVRSPHPRTISRGIPPPPPHGSHRMRRLPRRARRRGTPLQFPRRIAGHVRVGETIGIAPRSVFGVVRTRQRGRAGEGVVRAGGGGEGNVECLFESDCGEVRLLFGDVGDAV
mmetsp:Transcript_23991/g.45850  ORF Transcript_23991/g.45850 Transcript_23991/m.45850 type:complete len:218 (-) Transcript_23991:447-1100(-)